MRRHHTSKFRKFIVLLMVIGIIVAGYFYYTIFLPIDKSNTEEVSIMIKRGTSANQVAGILYDEGLIRDKMSFYGYVRFNKIGGEIVAGRYLLNKSMNIPKIIKEITTAASSETVITIQEGLTVNDIDDKLVEIGSIEPGDFEQAVKNFDDYSSYDFLDREVISALEFPLEGYLYPDTYYIDAVLFESDKLVLKMLDNFEAKFEDLEPFYNAQDRSMHEAITMASILQREVRTPKDYDTISGILWKRLDSNWHIGADATILYATKKKTIDYEDLEFDSPYNTRLHTGMPPGPIANPDIEHIEAALTPEESDYWYYLTTLDTGEVIYASTNDEHNVNKAKYL